MARPIACTQAVALPDLLQPGLDLVICGTAAGEKSARLGQYYAHPSNRFWSTLHEVGLTPVLLAPSEFPRLVEFGIGLTDIEKRRSGSDRVALGSDCTADALHRAMAAVRPRALAFNGKRAAEIALSKRRVTFGLQAETIEGVPVFVLPSTSGAARGVWSLQPWKEIAAFLRG